MLQLIYELRKNWRGWTDGTGRKSKALQEVLADLKMPSEMEVAARYTLLLTPFTLFTLMTIGDGWTPLRLL